MFTWEVFYYKDLLSLAHDPGAISAISSCSGKPY